MEEFLLQLGNGLAVGGIYALIALGYTMVYGVLKLINFAHGELFALGSYLGLTALVPLGVAGGNVSISAVALCLGFCLALALFLALRGRKSASVAKVLGATVPDAKLPGTKAPGARSGRPLWHAPAAAALVLAASGFALRGLFSVGLLPLVGGVAGVLLAAALCVGLVAVVGFLLERVAYRPLRRSNRLAAVVSALGASIFLQNAMMLAYGPDDLVYPGDILPSKTVLRVIVCLVSLGLMCGLYWFIQKTRTGTAIRAVAIDQDVARLMGVDVNRVISQVFMIGAALGAAAGLMLGLYYGKIRYDMGLVYGLKAFTAAILGGIGNIPGAMLGGILLGVIEALGAAYISIAWKDAIAFLVLIAILMFRPTGILGERTAEKL